MSEFDRYYLDLDYVSDMEQYYDYYPELNDDGASQDSLSNLITDNDLAYEREYDGDR